MLYNVLMTHSTSLLKSNFIIIKLIRQRVNRIFYQINKTKQELNLNYYFLKNSYASNVSLKILKLNYCK